MMKLREWLESSGRRYASEVREILSLLGYGSDDRSPPFQVIDGDRDELLALTRTMEKIIIVPPAYSAASILPLVPSDLAAATVLFIGPGLHEYPLAVASESLTFCLCFMECCLRYAAQIPGEVRGFQDLSTDHQAFSLAMQHLAARLAFDRFLNALVDEHRPFDVANFLQGFHQSWDAALGLSRSNRDLSRTSCLCVLAELSGRAVALKKRGLDIWDRSADGHPSPADLLRSSFGPQWRGLPDLLAELDSFDTALSRRTELAERLKALAEPNDLLSIAVHHMNRASETFWNEELSVPERGRAIADDFNRALDAIEEALRSGLPGAREQLEAFAQIVGQVAVFYSNQPDVTAATTRFVNLIKRQE